MSYTTPELTSTFSPCTRTRSYPSARPTSTSSTFHSGEINPCHDSQQGSIGYVADVRTSTVYEPKDLAEIDDLCVKQLFFYRPSFTSTHESARSIATPPPESDLDDEQIRALLASHQYLQEREASADRSQVYHCERILSVEFISSSEEYGETLLVVLKQKKIESRNIFRQKILP